MEIQPYTHLGLKVMITNQAVIDRWKQSLGSPYLGKCGLVAIGFLPPGDTDLHDAPSS
jgi:hypothetical protein